MDKLLCGFVFVLLQVDCLHSVYISDSTDSLHQVLSEFHVVQPVRTNSAGHFLSRSLASKHLQRRKRHTPLEETPRSTNNDEETQWREKDKSAASRGRSLAAEEIFYNVTVFGQELHLRLRPNLRLVAPAATVEWWEESGDKQSQPIEGAGCLYTGEVSNMADTSVAISNCDGLAGVIRTDQDEFFIEPLHHQKMEEDGDGEEEGRRHIVYRSSAIISKRQAINFTSDDTLLGSLVGSVRNRNTSGAEPRSTRRRRYIEGAELFNIEVLLAVDYSVLLFHGRDHMQKYLLTLMNIVNEIYQHQSLGANINIVLVRIIMLPPSKSLELIAVGDPQKSLKNVCGWSYLQQREQSLEEQHDHTIYLTRQEFGPSGMQGYAPVTGMCQLHRSCVLVIEDGFMSAFVAAHETGHVLGMEHDGEVNDCEDDVSLGSIMSPRVQATFHRYHWSRCSWRELHKYLDTYDCLRDDPFHHEWPAQPPLPGFHYTMDQQCRFDFGPGFSLCTTYPNIDPCKQLWCSEYYNPFYCKTKKGPPLDGTKCAPGKHCFKGYCMKLTPDLYRHDGGWGAWGPYGKCSRTCGSGVRFRARRCDNPAPANGGRTCFGNSFEFQLCSQEECPPLTDFRAEQCKAWNDFLEHEGKKHHWLPIEHPDPDERCRLFCRSKETGEVVSLNRMVHDGTPCSYSDAYSVCVRGECEHVGCDRQIASDQQEDRCGVCGGDNSSCRIVKGNFTRSSRKPGYLKILEIPRGARHLMVQEFKGTPHILAVKNAETGHLFLNDDNDFPETRTVIEKGVAWEYLNSEEREYIKTTGPLTYSVLLMVHPHGDTKVTLSYRYVIENQLRSSLESNLVQEDGIFYEWALKKWSQCSKSCGGGKQFTRFGCRRKADGKMVQRTFCANINKPRAIGRLCNTATCSVPRWISGPWERCTSSCGQSGWQRRWVSCQQDSSVGQRVRSVPSKLCTEQRPDTKQPCNRFPCPPSWRAGPWTPCSVSCGNGTQERQVACFTPEGSVGNCSQTPPISNRTCRAPPCGGDPKNFMVQWLSRSSTDIPAAAPSPSKQRCRGDRSVFCRMEALTRYCSIASFRQMCCKSCISRSRLTTQMTTPMSLTDVTTAVTALTTSRTSTDFVYVDYDDYDEYSSYEDKSASVSTTRATSSSIMTATSAAPFDVVPVVTADSPTSALVRTFATTEVPTTLRTENVIVNVTASPDRTFGGRVLKVKSAVSKPHTAAMSSSNNNSVDEVSYRIIGLDSDNTKGQQSVFVSRMPRTRERTQNKRIQELLNEKRRQGRLRRASRDF
ncbi:A disintegrin and metalloproteinase with thrombospondin motifs 2-like [Neosynchiropus ocellatus]